MNESKKYHGLSGEFKRFNKLLKPIHRLHRDTIQAIEDVIKCEDLSEEHVCSLRPTENEVTTLHQRLQTHLNIVITGQDNYGKVAILTKLLGTRLLPFSGPQHTCNADALDTNSPQDVQEQVTSTTTVATTTSITTRSIDIASQVTADGTQVPRIQSEVKQTLTTEVSCSRSMDKDVTGGDINVFCCEAHNESLKPLPHLEGYEKPWRGIKIAYSASQVSYSVVRPGSQESDCLCNEDKARPVGQEPCKSSTCEKPLSFQIQPPNSFAPSILNADQPSVVYTPHALPDKTSKIEIDGLPVLADDITVAQLEYLLETKLQTHIENQKKQVCLERRPDIAVKEIPLIELELGSRHLKDPILRDALLDVGINHCLLREQVHVIVTPTINKYPTMPNSTLLQDFSIPVHKSDVNDNVSSASEVSSDSVAFAIPDQADTLQSEAVIIPKHNQEATLKPGSSRHLSPLSAPISGDRPSTVGNTSRGTESLPYFLSKTNSKTSDCARSPSMVYGTPLLLDPNAEGTFFPPASTSTSSSNESCHSFKSLPPVESSSNFPLPEPFSITKPFQLTRSFSHNLSHSQQNHSGLLFYNVHPATPMDSDLELDDPDQTKQTEYASTPRSALEATALSLNSGNECFHSPASSLTPRESPTSSVSKAAGAEDSCLPTVGANTPTEDVCESKVACGFTSSDLPLDPSRSCLDGTLLESKGFIGTLLPNVTAIILYAITREDFSEQELQELKEIREHSPPCPVMFVRVPPLLQALQSAPPSQHHLLLAEYGILPQPSPPSTPEVLDSPVAIELAPEATAVLKVSADGLSSSGILKDGQRRPTQRTTVSVMDVELKVADERAIEKTNTSEVPVTRTRPVDIKGGGVGRLARFQEMDDDLISPGGSEKQILPDHSKDAPLEGKAVTPAEERCDPMVFRMDRTPTNEPAFNRELGVKSVVNRGKGVKFTANTGNEKTVLTRQLSWKSKEFKPKREKGLILVGNCLEAYTDEEVRKITEKTAKLYSAVEHERISCSSQLKQDIYDEGIVVECSANNASKENKLTGTKKCLKISKDSHQSNKAACKISEKVMRILRDELGFFRDDASSSSFVAHCHIACENLGITEQAKNPFVSAYNRPAVLPTELDETFVGPKDTRIAQADEVSSSAVETSSSPLDEATSGASECKTSTEKVQADYCSELCVESDLIETFAEFDRLREWTKRLLRSHVAYTSQLLNKVQSRCLSSFVVFAFEFCRRQQITPRRLAYARQQEEALYCALLDAARHKEEHIRLLISRTLGQDRDVLLQIAKEFKLPDSLHLHPQEDDIEGEVLSAGNSTGNDSGVEPTGAGTSSRSWPRESPHEESDRGDSAWCESVLQECVLRAINRRVGSQLVSGVQGLRENCLGTLRRCLSQLEDDCERGGELPSVTHALRRLVNAAYQVEARPTSSWGLLRGVWERVKELLGGGAGGGGVGASVGSRSWKCQVAEDMINGLSERRLARTISAQVCGEIKSAHSMFLSNLALLEKQLQCSLADNERRHRQLKSVHAPRLARLALHTEAINNRINHGLPELSGELGRGHFGVVYSCAGWGPFAPCAVKTLLPRDNTQWRDIAMQYHYTRLMGYHPRIVSIHACLIDKYYGEATRPALRSKLGGGGGSHRTDRSHRGDRSWRGGVGGVGGAGTQCVLLVMDVHKCDLDAAIRMGLMWYQRFRIALDVVQGIRFLHSQGLVHRDIKAKNVLIDEQGRARITDLDFCKPEAMITGSVVGTPIHMAPELFHGNYDYSVDVYAFGVLLWYICSGKTNMPKNYCLQKSKEELKNAVYKGVRPEQLATFTPECWDLMEQCWAPDPRNRILLGIVEDRLRKMLDDCLSCLGNQTESTRSGVRRQRS